MIGRVVYEPHTFRHHVHPVTSRELMAVVGDQDAKVWHISLEGVKHLRPRLGRVRVHGFVVVPQFWSRSLGRAIWAEDCYATRQEAWQALAEQAGEWSRSLERRVAEMHDNVRLMQGIANHLAPADAACLLESVARRHAGTRAEHERCMALHRMVGTRGTGSRR